MYYPSLRFQWHPHKKWYRSKLFLWHTTKNCTAPNVSYGIIKKMGTIKRSNIGITFLTSTINNVNHGIIKCYDAIVRVSDAPTKVSTPPLELGMA